MPISIPFLAKKVLKMKSNNTTPLCSDCARTGIITATLVLNPETKERAIAVNVCEHRSHTKPDLAWRNVEAMRKATGLPVVVVDEPIRPVSWGDNQTDVSAA